MANPPRTSKLAAAADISKSYASEILSGARVPSQDLAIRIFRATGWKPANIEKLTNGEIDRLEKLLAKAAA
jgi:plasmid maintenance system antidote protein VapI